MPLDSNRRSESQMGMAGRRASQGTQYTDRMKKTAGSPPTVMVPRLRMKIGVLVSAFQRRMAFPDPEAISVPLLEKATAQTKSVCPLSTCFRWISVGGGRGGGIFGRATIGTGGG
jgi:hypothetical protein